MPVPRISVVIPTYNREQYLAESLDSVLAQEFMPFEVIVVDDGSTDGTAELLKTYVDRVVCLQQENQGVAAATMRGIEAASAPLVALHDSDDRMLPGRLQIQCEFLDTHPEVAAVAGNMVFQGNEETNYLESVGVVFDAQGRCVLSCPHEQIVVRNFMANASSTFCRKTFLEAGGYDLTYRAVQDGEFWFRVARTWTLACLNHPCTWVRVHGESLSQSAVALECKLRLYSRELASGDLTSPQVRAIVARRLGFLARDYINRFACAESSQDWRRVARIAARQSPFFSWLRLAMAARLPLNIAKRLC